MCYFEIKENADFQTFDCFYTPHSPYYNILSDTEVWMGLCMIHVSKHRDEFTFLSFYHFQQEQVWAHLFSTSFKKTAQYIATNTPSALFASKILYF